MTVEQMITYVTGGAGTIGLVLIGLLVSGRLVPVTVVQMLRGEIEKRDLTIRELTTDLHNNNESVRHDVVPVLAQIVQVLPAMRRVGSGE